MTTTTGTGIFYDGLTSNRREVAVELGGDIVRVTMPGGDLLAQWRFAEISPLAAALLARANPTDRTGLTDHRTRVKVVAFSLAAIVTLIGGAIWGVPLLAD